MESFANSALASGHPKPGLRLRGNRAVIMAGGFGRRLSPLTDECPKPLLKVGTKPLLEIMVESLAAYGLRHLYIAVHYKADMIGRYFLDGRKWGAEIEYVHEQRRLGTAGALSLLPSQQAPLLVVNGDLLTKADFGQLLDFHAHYGGAATMAVVEREIAIPYGVVSADNDRFLGIAEKPSRRVLANAGIYVLAPEALSLVRPDTFTDMPALFDQLVHRGDRAGVFTIRDYWLDIGRPEDYERANRDYAEVFA